PICTSIIGGRARRGGLRIAHVRTTRFAAGPSVSATVPDTVTRLWGLAEARALQVIEVRHDARHLIRAVRRTVTQERAVTEIAERRFFVHRNRAAHVGRLWHHAATWVGTQRARFVTAAPFAAFDHAAISPAHVFVHADVATLCEPATARQ